MISDKLKFIYCGLRQNPSDHSHIINGRPLFKVGYLMVKCVRAAINLISIDTSIFAKCKGQDFILTFFSACSLDH